MGLGALIANNRYCRKMATATCLWFLFVPFSFSQAANLTSLHKPLPVAFELNRGQVQPGIDAVARADAYTVYIRAGQATLHLNRSNRSNAALGSDRGNRDAGIRLLGANKQPECRPEEKLPGYSNFLFGRDQKKWITDVTHYAKIRYANVYPGVDVIYHGNQDGLENDFVVLPGADPRQIALGFSNTLKPLLNKQGDLVLRLGSGEFRLHKPRAYQLIAGAEVEVAAAYFLRDGQAHFRLGRYAPDTTLIIDPVLVYSTFLGGGFGLNGSFQSASAVAVDGSGSLYVAGFTDSSSFPVSPGTVGQTSQSAYVSKINATGTSLIYSTYIAGMPSSFLFTDTLAMAVDAAGDVYLASRGAAGLPIPAGSTPFQSAEKSLALLKLNSTATAVLAGTYLGGSGPNPDSFGGIAVDRAGSVYITGSTSAVDFPTQDPLQPSLGSSGMNAFVTKLNPAMSALVYSTYLGQASSAGGAGIAIDASGNAYVAGGAGPGFPTTADAFQSAASSSGAFLAKLNPAGSTILYATYLAGGAVANSEPTAATAVAVDGSGNVYVAGENVSPDFPVVNPVQPCTGDGPTSGSSTPNDSVFLSEFNPVGALIFSTCMGNIVSGPVSLVLDASGNVYISGLSDDTLPLMNPLLSNSQGSFISEFDSAAHTLSFSTYVGQPTVTCCDGSGDHVDAIAVDSIGSIYAVGYSNTADTIDGADQFPIFNALQPLFGDSYYCGPGCGFLNSIIMKISPNSDAAAAVAPSEVNFPLTEFDLTPSPRTVTVQDLGTDPLTISNVAVTGDFTQTNNCGTVAPSGGTCSIQVIPPSTPTGGQTGILTITDSSPGNPHTVPIVGPPAAASTNGFALSSVSAPATVNAGASADYVLEATTGLSFSGSVQFTCTGMPAASTCSVSPNPVSIGGGGPVLVFATVATTARMSSQSNVRDDEVASVQHVPSWSALSSLLLVGIVFAPAVSWRKGTEGRWNLLLSIVLSAISIGTLGCGGGGGSGSAGGGGGSMNGTPGGTYTIVITGTSGGIMQSAKLTLTVQ
jgi:hypothetical protein